MPTRAKPAFKVDFFSPVCGNSLLKVDEPTSSFTVKCSSSVVSGVDGVAIILVKLSLNEQELSDDVLKYINRLSDYLFTLGRYANVLDNYTEIKSKKREPNRING